MKHSNNSILGKYSDGSYRKKGKKEMPLMANYDQRYKGSLSREITEPEKPMTLDEKIASRNKKETAPQKTERVSVEIGGVNYLLGCSEELSAAKIRRIAQLADEIYNDTKENNPYIATNKTAVLSLIECCDRYLTLKAENDNLKTELMYYRQKDLENSVKEAPKELTPMEKLANGEEIEQKPRSNISNLMKTTRKDNE